MYGSLFKIKARNRMTIFNKWRIILGTVVQFSYVLILSSSIFLIIERSPPCHDAGPMWRSRARGWGVCWANLACVHHHTSCQTSIIERSSSFNIFTIWFAYSACLVLYKYLYLWYNSKNIIISYWFHQRFIIQ